METGEDKKRRVLFLVTEDWYFVSHRIGLARAVRDAGCEVVVVTRTKDHQDIIRNEGFRIIEFLLPRSRLSLISELKSIVNLIRVYRNEKPDLVHHVALKPSLYGSIAAIVARTPAIINAMTGLGFVFTRGSWKSWLLQPAVSIGGRLLFNRPEMRMVIQNLDDAATLEAAGVSQRRAMTLVRGSGVSLKEFKALPEPESYPTIAMVSRMLWNKGVGELVEASRLLKARGLKFRIALVGMPDPENPSNISAQQLCHWHDEGLVQWWGFRDDVSGVWSKAHVAVLPSYREGLPKSLLEAAACGRPIVATDVPGCREIVEHESNGFLVPLYDVKALADALEKLITDRDLGRRMGARSRELVETHFEENIVIDKTLGVYEELFGVPLPRPA